MIPSLLSCSCLYMLMRLTNVLAQAVSIKCREKEVSRNAFYVYIFQRSNLWVTQTVSVENINCTELLKAICVLRWESEEIANFLIS